MQYVKVYEQGAVPCSLSFDFLDVIASPEWWYESEFE